MGVDNCERLTEVLDLSNQDQLAIRYTLVGGGSEYHLPSMRLGIEARLPLICQRCLQAMTMEIEVAFDYIVSPTEPEEVDMDDEADWVESSREMNLSELVEDELLIAIPLAPTHDHDCQPVKLESGEKPNPFAVLKGVIK